MEQLEEGRRKGESHYTSTSMPYSCTRMKCLPFNHGICFVRMPFDRLAADGDDVVPADCLTGRGAGGCDGPASEPEESCLIAEAGTGGG